MSLYLSAIIIHPLLLELSVFKPKDEEPYGRLNPKVSVICSTASFILTVLLTDDQMAAPPITIHNSIWTRLSYTQLKVQTLTSLIPINTDASMTVVIFLRLQLHSWIDVWI